MVLRNLFSMSIMRVASALLTLALVIVFSRLGGIQQLGQFSLLITLFLFFQLLPLAGLHLYLIREISTKPDSARQHLPNALLLALCVSLLLAVGLGVGGALVYRELPEIHAALWWVALSLIPTAPIAVVEAALLAQQRMDAVALRNVLENIGRTAVAVGLVATGHDLTAVFIVFFVGRVLVASSYLRSAELPSLLDFTLLSAAILRSYLVNMPTFLGITLLSALSSRLDMLLMSKLATAEQLGLYAAVYKLFEMGLMVPQVITVVLLPRLGELRAKSVEAMTQGLVTYLRFPIVLGAPFLILMSVNSGLVLSMFGPQAAVGATALAVLLPALLGAGINQLLALAMLVMGRSDLDLRTLVIGTLMTVVLLVTAIPRWGAVGAASVALAMSLALPALRLGFLARQLSVGGILRQVGRAFVPAWTMVLVMLASGAFTALAPPVQAALGLVAYLATASALGNLSLVAFSGRFRRDG